MKINFRNPDYFRSKFKREPKLWSIEDLHALWIKTSERNNKRQSIYWELIRQAGETLPGDKYHKTVYYYHTNKDGKEILRKFDIRFNQDYYGWSIGHDTAKLENREDKLNYWIADETNFEFGRKISEAQKFTSARLNSMVFHLLTEEVNRALNRKFKESKTVPPKAFTIFLGGIEYIITTDDGYGYSHNHFTIITKKKTIEI